MLGKYLIHSPFQENLELKQILLGDSCIFLRKFKAKTDTFIFSEREMILFSR